MLKKDEELEKWAGTDEREQCGQGLDGAALQVPANSQMKIKIKHQQNLTRIVWWNLKYDIYTTMCSIIQRIHSIHMFGYLNGCEIWIEGNSLAIILRTPTLHIHPVELKAMLWRKMNTSSK